MGAESSAHVRWEMISLALLRPGNHMCRLATLHTSDHMISLAVADETAAWERAHLVYDKCLAAFILTHTLGIGCPMSSIFVLYNGGAG
jgi:hypothetical protein